MRLAAVAALAFVLAACGGGGGEELAAGNSQLTPAQVDAALGPADQTAIEDAIPAGNGDNAIDALGNEAGIGNGGAAVEDGEDE
ncbi:MAG TPA: hypothetical protein VD768_02285 [Sphingomicrobium sp.]|nr:hypothetical protein [Sphingomicrobium sp.]